MTVRDVCDAAYGILYEWWREKGASLDEALDRLANLAAPWTWGTPPPGTTSEAQVAASNEAALQQLQAMFGGL